MRIVNLIHIGDQVLSLDDMDPMKKAEIALRLNEQSLKTLGQASYYRSRFVRGVMHHVPP